jgi:hypothetical protein
VAAVAAVRRCGALRALLSTCSTGISVISLTRSIRPSSSQTDFSPERVEIRISSSR